MFIIKIGEILSREQGFRQSHNISGRILEGEGDFKADANLLRISDGIHVHLQNGQIKIKFVCGRCNEPFDEEIKIPSAQREFYTHVPPSIAEGEEIFLINMKDSTIDLTEMIREEILLHFPLLPLCSKSCKGLCQKCGKNLNKEKCSCRTGKKKGNKPLAQLKSLIK